MKPQEHMDYNVVYNVRVDRVEGYHHGYHWANNKKNKGQWSCLRPPAV
jgi:hypothetical protein